MLSMDFSSAVRNNDTEDVTTFTHDSTGQLTDADRSGTTNDEAYVYDDNGNRTSQTRDDATSTAIVGANNRVTNDGVLTYAHDNEGNVTSKTRNDTSVVVDDFRTEYTWDYRNRLTKVTGKQRGQVHLRMRTAISWPLMHVPC
jgi:YD repeat-containing protein